MMKKKKKKKNDFSTRKIVFIWAIIVLAFLFFSQAILYSLEVKQNQKIKEICTDKMIQYRSCDDLAFAKRYCEDAKEQYFENNCTVVQGVGWFWTKG